MATHGGARPGAGRKAKAKTHAGAIKKAEKRCADRLPQNLANLEALADGGIEQVTETIVEEPARTVTIDVTEVVPTEQGVRTVKVKKQAFPDVDPDTMVVTKRTRSVTKTAPDRAANEYLTNRVMGTPVQVHEFAKLTDAELIEEAARALGGDGEAGPAAPEV